MKGKSIELNVDPQIDLFEDLAEIPSKPTRPKGQSLYEDCKRKFIAPDRNQIFIGHTKLEDHLKETGQLEPLLITTCLDRLDWQHFVDRYAKVGRPAYAPGRMLGLILYGILHGQTSLREMERLARLDLGCMWVTGGIYPDHSSIGDFILMHEESLGGDCFKSLTETVLEKTQSSGERVAVDGTVVEAAGSRFKRLKEEAIQSQLETAQKKSEKAPEDETAQHELAQAEQISEIFNERKAARINKGNRTDTLSVSPTDPESMMQPQKHKRGHAFSYKPSVLANEARVITAIDVDPSNEVSVVEGMLEQSREITGNYPEELMGDGGYFANEMIEVTLAHDISLLSSEKAKHKTSSESKVFQKRDFRYIESENVYICPAGEKLTTSTTGQSKAAYTTTACQSCGLRDQCSKAKQGRRIRREPGDIEKELLREAMRHPQAQKILSQRKAMVEPVFSVMRLKQGLNRFRRKGLKGVKLEFSLHALAYNLSRYIAAALSALLLLLFKRLYSIEELIVLVEAFQNWSQQRLWFENKSITI